MITFNHAVAIFRMPMTRWTDNELLACYHKELVNNQPSHNPGTQIIYNRAILQEMERRGWNELKYIQEMVIRGKKVMRYHQITPAQLRPVSHRIDLIFQRPHDAKGLYAFLYSFGISCGAESD
jgi:hypothetical protein